MRDVEGAIGEGERATVPDVQLEPRRHPQAWLAHDRGGQDLGAAVDAGHPKVAAVPGGPGQEGGGDIGGTRADIEDGQGGAVSGQRIDRPCRQPRATEPSIRPLEVAQVATQGGRIVKRPIQQFLDIGHALHPSRLHADYHRAMIVVAGEALMDLFVGPDGSVAANAGGGPYNTARTIARLGQPVTFLGRISSDRFGRDLRATLARDGVAADGVIETDDPTTLALVELDEHGVAGYHFYVDGTSAAGLTDADAAAVMTASAVRDALHVGTLGLVLEPVGTTIERLVMESDTERLVMLDPNCRPSATPDPAAFRARIDRIARRADVVKVSDDDLRFLAPDVEPEAMIERLLGNGVRVVLRTHGADDVEIRTRSARASVAVPPVDVVDTVARATCSAAVSWRHGSAPVEAVTSSRTWIWCANPCEVAVGWRP